MISLIMGDCLQEMKQMKDNYVVSFSDERRWELESQDPNEQVVKMRNR
jgi:hypothetical protein